LSQLWWTSSKLMTRNSGLRTANRTESFQLKPYSMEKSSIRSTEQRTVRDLYSTDPDLHSAADALFTNPKPITNDSSHNQSPSAVKERRNPGSSRLPGIFENLSSDSPTLMQEPMILTSRIRLPCPFGFEAWFGSFRSRSEKKTSQRRIEQVQNYIEPHALQRSRV
jgi:hypothetical protein